MDKTFLACQFRVRKDKWLWRPESNCQTCPRFRRELFVGAPASAKTLYLQVILEIINGIYFDGSNTTSRILDVLEEERPKIICIDEPDKLSRQFQNQLLNFMESGKIDVEQQKKQYHFEIKGAKVFATCNEINRVSKPLQSRFKKLFGINLCSCLLGYCWTIPMGSYSHSQESSEHTRLDVFEGVDSHGYQIPSKICLSALLTFVHHYHYSSYAILCPLGYLWDY